jgi:hypothetical protein
MSFASRKEGIVTHLSCCLQTTFARRYGMLCQAFFAKIRNYFGSCLPPFEGLQRLPQEEDEKTALFCWVTHDPPMALLVTSGSPVMANWTGHRWKRGMGGYARSEIPSGSLAGKG